MDICHCSFSGRPLIQLLAPTPPYKISEQNGNQSNPTRQEGFSVLAPDIKGDDI